MCGRPTSAAATCWPRPWRTGVGEERLREIVERYGTARTRKNSKALLDYSERVTRDMLRSIPDGDYRFEDFLDNDGVTEDPVLIAVCVRIRGDRAEVDFTGSSPQVAGPVNANYAIAVAAAMYCFRCLISADVPYNAGLLRPIHVIAPERSVVNAGLPAAMAAGNVETSQRITDVIFGALAQAIPDRIPAASSGTMNNLSFGGWDSRRNRPFSYYETIAGGHGRFGAGRWPIGSPHAHDEQLEHACRSVRARISGAGYLVSDSNGLRRRRKASRW